MELNPGTEVDGRYRILAPLGAGGMAKVYRALDERLGIEVALKVLSIQSSGLRDRLIQEGRVQAALRSPNVVPVTDIVDVGGWPGLVMELVPGPSLEWLLERHRLNPIEAEHVARGFLSGVAAAHRLGLVHRDLKPGNILLDPRGDRLLAKVADFGLVKLLEDGHSGTRSGATVGTPRYMAPEQIRDSSTVDARADVFSAGAILYEIFSGRPAHEGADNWALFQAIIEGHRAPLTEAPERVIAAVEAALDPDRDRRPESCGALLELLDRGDGAPREAWSAATLATVQHGSVELTSALKTPRATSDTWTGSEVGGLVSQFDTLDAVAPGPAPSRSRWGMGLAALSLAAALVAGVWWSRPAKPAAFTLASAPAVRVGGPTVQRLLDQAWAEYRDNEDIDAAQHLDQALQAGGEDAAVHLLYAAIELGFSDLNGMGRHLEQGAALDAGGSVGALLQTLDSGFAEGEDLSWWGPALLAHSQRYPDDRLARLLYGVGMVRAPGQVALDREALDALVQADPDGLAGWLVEIEALRVNGEPDQARMVARQATERLPAAPALHEVRARIEISTGHPKEAAEHATRALALDPGWWPARLIAGIAAASLGDTEAYERLVSPMRGAETPPSQRHRFGQHMAGALTSFGQLREGGAWQQEVIALSEELGDRSVELEVLSDRVNDVLHPWIGSDAAIRERLSALDQAAADPTIAAAARRRHGQSSLLAHGVLDARAGELAAARRTADRLRTESPAGGEVIEAEIARQAVDLEALSSTLPECRGLLFAGTALVDLGEWERATPVLAAAKERCPGNHSAPFALVAAGQAKIAAARGDPQALADALAEFDAIWRRPDADLPVVIAVGALRP